MRLKPGSQKPTILILALLFASVSRGQTLQGAALVRALQHGGYVVVMRHASSPREPPSKELADPENVTDERQLDEQGKAAAIAMGNALRELKVPVGAVISSPTFRALQTIKYARLGAAQTSPELGENGKSMQGGTEVQAKWLQDRVRQFPSGTNTFIVTHYPNIMGAFPQIGTPPTDGEALVFGPDGKGGATVVARIKMEDWPSLRP